MLATMVLAAGLGSRLRPLTDVLPKPLVPVGDRSALGHVLSRIKEAGAGRIVVNAHHRASQVRAAVEREFPGVEISDERELLGTGGGLAQAASLLGVGDVLVWNADCFAEVDLDGLIAGHASSRAEATLVVQPRARGEGSVGVDGQGRVVRLRRERVADEASGAEFLGVHVLGESLRATLPRSGCVVGDSYIPALLRGAPLHAVVHEGPFFDIGTPRTYLEANLAWLTRRSDASRASTWTGEAARVSSAVSMDRAVVGAGAQVKGEGRLERCVVWPGAVATAPLSDAIVAGDVVLRIA